MSSGYNLPHRLFFTKLQYALDHKQISRSQFLEDSVIYEEYQNQYNPDDHVVPLSLINPAHLKQQGWA